jgi:hypothetical protein
MANQAACDKGGPRTTRGPSDDREERPTGRYVNALGVSVGGILIEFHVAVNHRLVGAFALVNHAVVTSAGLPGRFTGSTIDEEPSNAALEFAAAVGLWH